MASGKLSILGSWTPHSNLCALMAVKSPPVHASLSFLVSLDLECALNPGWSHLEILNNCLCKESQAVHLGSSLMGECQGIWSTRFSFTSCFVGFLRQAVQLLQVVFPEY
jgi:hypothetical protein